MRYAEKNTLETNSVTETEAKYFACIDQIKNYAYIQKRNANYERVSTSANTEPHRFLQSL